MHKTIVTLTIYIGDIVSLTRVMRVCTQGLLFNFLKLLKVHINFLSRFIELSTEAA